MLRRVKIHDSMVRDLVGSTNREKRGFAEAATTKANLLAVGKHNENSDDILVCLYLFTSAWLIICHVCAEIYLAS